MFTTMEDIQFFIKPLYVENLVLIDGISRAGKFFLGKIVSGFENMEYFQHISILEHLPFFTRLGSISRNAAVALIRIAVDEHSYYMRIGRNLNLRMDDASSVHNSPRWHDYVKRSVSTLDDLEGAIADKNRYNLFVLHECLASIDIFFEAFPCMKWINLLRHPIDLVHSWYLRGWGYRFTTDPLSFFPMIKGEKSATPWFAWNRRDDFVKTSGIDSIIFSIASLMELGQKAFLNIEPSHKRQVVSICYEDLVENTSRILEVLSSFLEDSPSDGMQVILSREKCPRVLSEEKRKAKMEDIQQIANQESFKLLLHLVNEYESGNYYRIFQQ